MFGKVLFVLGIVLTLSQVSLAATDYYATPSGAGSGDGLSWSNAFSQSQIDDPRPGMSVVDSRMQPGDVLHLGSGTYTLPIHLDSSGTSSSLKRIIGENTGSGLPLMDLGNWSRTDDPSNHTWAWSAIGFGNAASYWSIENLIIQDVRYGIKTDDLSTAGQYSGIALRSRAIRNCEHPIYIYDANGWLIENIDAREYLKHGFRFDHNCTAITVHNCTADLSGGDPTWYDFAETYPFGFFVDTPGQGEGASSNITFEDCLAQHHRTNAKHQTDPSHYWNGDGFVLNSQGNTSSSFSFVR